MTLRRVNGRIIDNRTVRQQHDGRHRLDSVTNARVRTVVVSQSDRSNADAWMSSVNVRMFEQTLCRQQDGSTRLVQRFAYALTYMQLAVAA